MSETHKYQGGIRLVATFFLLASLLACGCASQRTLRFDAENPAVRVSTVGIYFGDERVEPKEVVEILEDYDVSHERVIHILLDPDVTDLRPARFLMSSLSRAGYTRPVLVTKRHASSMNLGKPKTSSSLKSSAPKSKRVIRYKKANE